MLITETALQHVQISNETDEGSLWLEFQSGNKAAYSFIYEQYSNNLYNYGMQMVRNNHLVEDAIQDLFVNLWRCRKNLTPVKSIKFYLLTCLRREIIKKIKKENKFIRDNRACDQKSFQFRTSVEDEIIEEEVSVEKKEKLDHVLQRLSKRQREIIYLKFYEDLSYPQIAEHLGLDLKYTYNVASRAFGLIRKHFVSAFCCFLFLFNS
ncbi:MAG: sigma-70 family RNA polymerase sigma factor [Cyclobacteriaceae bacterium]